MNDFLNRSNFIKLDRGTTLFDIYEAAGGVVNEERTHVTITGPMKPFKIELLVYPTGVSSSWDGPDEVTLGVLLDTERILEETALGGIVHEHTFDAELKLPVSQVKIKEDQGTPYYVVDHPWDEITAKHWPDILAGHITIREAYEKG